MSDAVSLNGYKFKDDYCRNKLENDVDRLDSKIDTGDASLSTRIDNLVSQGIAPIPVSATSQMTDRSKIYVLTTTGNWYYYDGAWTIGGQYQASEDSTTLSLTKGGLETLEKYRTEIVGIPVKGLNFGYISATAGTNQTDSSRLRTDEYVGENFQHIYCDFGYSVSVYFYDADDVYQGRLLTDYTISTEAGSESVVMLWATDLDINAIKGLYPNYNLKLVARKDDYSSIQDLTAFLSHFKSYIKIEEKLINLNQNHYFEYINQNAFTIGDLNNDGTPNTSINYRMYSDKIADTVDIVEGINNRKFKIFAYQISDDSCVGRLDVNGNFSTTGNAYTPSIIDFRDLRKRFPSYYFKIVAFVSGVTNKTTLLQSRNIIFKMTRKHQDTTNKELTPEVTAIPVPNTANHDMTWINNKLYIFDGPSSSYNGKLSILNDDFTVAKIKYTNFNYLLKDGTTRSYCRMKSVDYNPTNHILLVGNGQVPELTGNSKLFLFYNVDDWYSSAYVDITFANCGEYKAIDVSNLGNRAYAFWKNHGETNEIYVTDSNLKHIWLIELGKGSVNLGEGEFESTTSDKYNGSYKIKKCWTQLNDNLVNLNAHGGQVYNGELYLASNNENECTIFKAILGNDGTLRFDRLECDVFENNTSKYSYIDGMAIKDGVITADPLNINGVYNTGTNKVLLQIKI